MSVETLNIKAECLENEIGAKSLELKAIRQEIAEILCPYLVGDIIVNGKDLNQKVIVESISYGGWSCKYKVTGKKIKKDGSPCKYSSELWYPQNWVKVEA